MKKRVELPLIEPLYSTYQNQGACTAILSSNQSICNWYYNQVMNLSCNRKFLSGFTTPQINIIDSTWNCNPYLDKRWMSTEFAKGHINPIIREFLNRGFYVAFGSVDDYYIKGKSWYKKRHFAHDGLICGYDQNDKTYCIYAYNSDWVYRKFWISQNDFNAGRIYMHKKGKYSNICGLKVKGDKIEFSPSIALQNIKEYLDSSLEKYPWEGEGDVYGIVVHEYLVKYLEKLYDETIPYERMDWRVFRLVWEHKKVMLERIKKIEQELNLGDEISKKYQLLVFEADTMRMLYASHHMKRRDSVLPIMKKKLLKLMDQEKKLLTLLVEKTGGRSENDAVGISKE